MFAAGSNLKDSSPEEIFYQDFKKFEVGGRTLGIGQINSMSEDELEELRQRMVPFLEETYNSRGLDMIVFMLTNIIEESTTMLCYGEHAAQIVEDAFPPAKVENNVALVKSVVSRKKQVVPALIAAINRSESAML